MPDWDYPRSIVSTQLLVELGTDHAMSVSDCLADTGIDPAWLTDPHALIAAHQELTLLRNLKRAIPNPTLGLTAGTRYHLTTFGILGFALTSSPTLRHAFQFGVRNMDLTFMFCTVHLEETDDTLRMVFNDQKTPEDVRQFVVERPLSVLMNFYRELLGGLAPIQRLTLCWPQPADLSHYQDIFGITPEFDAERNCIEISARLADTPLPQANIYAEQNGESQCRALIAKRRAQRGVAAHVRTLLMQEIMTLHDMERVAHDLSMTTRTLRRKLKAEGTSFRALVDEVREVLANEFLSRNELRIDDIALRLGYADTPSFIHAFKRWKGRTPNAYRRS
jgi:AraC-like DNA-binding protein